MQKKKKSKLIQNMSADKCYEEKSIFPESKSDPLCRETVVENATPYFKQRPKRKGREETIQASGVESLSRPTERFCKGLRRGPWCRRDNRKLGVECGT